MQRIGACKSELTTPCVLLDIDAVDRNIEKMARHFGPLDCSLRPHAKTHKLPFIAHKQIEAGAIGITCAKLQDAEGFAAAGVNNILIANEIVSPEKIVQVVNLSQTADIIICIDNFQNATDLSASAIHSGTRLDVLVEVDVGLARCGLQPKGPTLEFVRKVSKLKGITFRGIMGYEGGLFNLEESEKTRICQERNRALVDTKQTLEQDGFEVEIISAGGANTYTITGHCAGITEIQPGSYVTMDDWNKKHGLDFEQAIMILTTVISRPVRHRIVTDAGLKAISMDHGLPRIVGHEGMTIESLSEEHGRLKLSDTCPSVRIGDKIEIVPSHGCTTIPLYERYVIMKDDVVVEELPLVSGSASY